MVQAKGAGYALSKQQELETMQRVAHATGVLLVTVTALWHHHCPWNLRCPELETMQRVAHATGVLLLTVALWTSTVAGSCNVLCDWTALQSEHFVLSPSLHMHQRSSASLLPASLPDSAMLPPH